MLLAAAAVGAPVAMGCTGPWARLALEGVMAAAAIIWAVSTRRPAWSLILPIAIAGLVCVQILPLPDALLRPLSPMAAANWKVTRAGLPATWGTVSIDPAATATAARRLLLGLVTLAAVADMSRCPRRRWLLAGALAVSAVVILSLGLLFRVDRQERKLLGFVDMKGPIEFWRTPVLMPVETSGWAYLEWTTVGDVRYLSDMRVIGDGFGSYVTSNQFAAGVYLTLPVLIAVLFVAGRRRVPSVLATGFATLLALAGVWVVGRMADSRAGAACLLLAGLVFWAVASPPGRLRRIAVVAVVAYAAFIVVFAALFLGDIKALTRLLPEDLRGHLFMPGDDGRATATRAALRMLLASPVLGVGLSTYGDLFPRIVDGGHVWYYAHNDYAQLLAETGLVGMVAATALVALIVQRFRRFIAADDPVVRILAAGAWASLAALLAHSVFDWNLHVPANAFLASLITGLCLGTGAEASRPDTVRPTSDAPAWLTAMFAAACVACIALLARDACADSAERSLRLAMVPFQGAPRDPHASPPKSPPRLAGAISAAERVAAWDPGNARLSLVLGQALLYTTKMGGSSDAAADSHRAALPSEADAWFRKASNQRAVCRGLAEADPRQRPAASAAAAPP